MQIFDVCLHRLQLLSNVGRRFLAAPASGGDVGRGRRGGPVLAFEVRGQDDLLRHGVLPEGEDTDAWRGKRECLQEVTDFVGFVRLQPHSPETNICYGQLLVDQVLG